MNNKFKHLSNCHQLYYFDNLLCAYKMDYVIGESIKIFKGYKYGLNEKIRILKSTLEVVKEAHENNILIN